MTPLITCVWFLECPIRHCVHMIICDQVQNALTFGLRSKKLWYLNRSRRTSFSFTSCSISDLEESIHLHKDNQRNMNESLLNHSLFTHQICPSLPLVDLGLVQEGLWFVHLDQNVGWGDGLADSEDAGIAFWQRTVSKPRCGGGQWAAIPRVIGRRHCLAVKSRTRIDASWNERHLSVTTQNGRHSIHMTSQMEGWAEWRIF